MILKKTHLLEIKNLSLSISNIPILKNISFNIDENEILGIVGESGSGKSITAFSILNLINSQETVRDGKIFLEGKRIDKLNEKQFEKIRGKKISIIFQEPMSSLNPSMKCGKQIEEIIIKHSVLNSDGISKRVNELIKMVRLGDESNVCNKYPFQLSGGQQQRIMIAIAIACNPKILIADEPTTSIDASIKNEIISLLKEIQYKTKMSIIFVSHELNLVSKFTNKIIVLFNGNIVESGMSSKILSNPKQQYTKMLIRAIIPKNIRPLRLPTIDNKLKKFPIATKKGRQKRHHKLYNSNPILQIKELNFSYQNNNILNCISFNLYKGETLGLVGESGSGKSTISKCILGINDYINGEIIYNKRDIKLIAPKIFRKNVQLIFQDPFSSLNPEMKIGDSILEPMNVHKIFKKSERKNEAIKLLEDVGLKKEDFHKYPTQFSGGQRQRIVIARALSVKPEIIICDESVSALDVSVQSQVLNLLNDLKETYSITLLFISHDLSVIRYMTDRIIVLKNGSIEEINETDSIFKNPKSTYTKDLLRSSGY